MQVVRKDGAAGLWEYLKDQFSDLKTTVMDAIMDIVQSQVIQAGIKWVMGLLTPVGAFIKAAMAIIDVVKFFIQRAAQIMELVKAFTDSIKAIASGNVGAVAKSIENALGKSIPVLIGFLASFLGISGLADKVLGVIHKIRERIVKSITKFWTFVKSKAKGLLGKVVGKSKNDNIHEPEKQKKIDAGFIYLKEEEKKIDENHNNKLTLEQANKVAKKTKAKYSVFSSLKAESKADKIIYRYTASPENVHETGTKLENTEKDGKNIEGSKLKLYTIQPLFTLYANNPEEFRQQLKRQEEGLNMMKVERWIANREDFVKNKRKAGDLDKLRKEIRKDIARAYREKNRAEFRNLDTEIVIKKSEEYAKTILTRNHAILHNPDQVAGGDAFLGDLYKSGEITDETSLKASKLVGHLGTNSSIGSQWSKDRANNLYDEVIKQTEGMEIEEKKNTFMNVNLNIG